MNNDYNNPAFKNLLKKLQEESWQLELLISGFAIFGLFSAWEAISMAAVEAKNSQILYKFVAAIVTKISCAILIFSLLLHVLLRGLWIGALGLRYVSGDIDYNELNYSEKFTKYLKRKVGSFDRYIGTLENYCSIIFAISFILIFYVLSMTFTIVAIGLIGNYIIGSDTLPGWIKAGVGIPLMIFISLGMIMTFIDFVTQGFLKKKKWLSKLYFPVYWVFSFITLSFLYRPLVYNLLDNKFGRRISIILFPIFILLFFSMSIYHNESNYFNERTASSQLLANDANYEDLLIDKSLFIDDVAIQSKVITDNYIKVFIVFTEYVEERVFKRNPSLKPKEDFRGLNSDIQFGGNKMRVKNLDSLRQEYLNTFNSIYHIKVDSLKKPSDFMVAKSLNNEFGLETYINTSGLKEGKHVLKVNRNGIKGKDTLYWNVATIPFWYFKD